MKREKHMTSYGGMRNLASELDYRDGWNNNHFEKGKAEVLNAYKERISVGQPMDGISELGGLDRQLLQSSEFFPAGNAILRKVTPEEETANALVDVGWIPNPIRETLLLMDLEDINKGPLLSVLRTIHRELFSSDERKKERGARALSWLVDPERHYLWDESNELDALLKAEGGLDTVNDTGQGEDEDCLAAEAEEFLNLGNPVNPEFTEECRAIAQTIKPRKEFRPPRDRYQFADRYRYNPNSEAKERRLYDLKGNLRAIQDLRSIEAIEKYLDLLREDYAEDVILWREWSLVRKEQDRKLYLQFLRAQELDEETIRAKLWACFDREAEKIAEGWQEKTPVKVGWFEHFNPQTNKVEEGEEGEKFEMTLEEVAELEKKLGRNPQVVETKFRYVKPCIWEIERSRAFRELHHTKGDWNKIYSKVWIAMEEALIGRARVADTADGRRFVRRKLGQWSFRLSNEAKIEIASILSEKEDEQRRNNNQGA